MVKRGEKKIYTGKHKIKVVYGSPVPNSYLQILHLFQKSARYPPVRFSFFLSFFSFSASPCCFYLSSHFQIIAFPNKPNKGSSKSFCRTSGLTAFQFASFLAIAKVYKTEGNEACLKEDYINAVYFYTEGVKVDCKDADVKAEL